MQKLTIITNFSLPLYLKIKKIKILKKQKQNTGDIITLQVCTKKKQSYEVPLWRYGVTDSIFGHFGPFFCLFISPPLTTQKIKILKKWKKLSFIGFLSLKTLSHSWSPVYIVIYNILYPEVSTVIFKSFQKMYKMTIMSQRHHQMIK